MDAIDVIEQMVAGKPLMTNIPNAAQSIINELEFAEIVIEKEQEEEAEDELMVDDEVENENRNGAAESSDVIEHDIECETPCINMEMLPVSDDLLQIEVAKGPLLEVIVDDNNKKQKFSFEEDG